MNKSTKSSTASKVLYVILVVFILMMFWPAGRATLQRGLMKIGLYKPKVEQPVSLGREESNDSPTPANESAVFLDEQSKEVNTLDLKDKVVFINFWATWCGPCVAEMPSIQALHDTFKDDDNVVFLLVEIEGDIAEAQQFMKKHNLAMPLYVPGGDIPTTWLSGAIPSTIVLDKAGQQVFGHKGMADYSDPKFVAFIRELAEN